MIVFCSCMMFQHTLLNECHASKKGLGCILLQPMDKNITDQDILDFSEKEMEEILNVSKTCCLFKQITFRCWDMILKHWKRTLRHSVWNWALKHFTFGRKTRIITDHKPLLPLFQKSLINTTPHLSRLLLHVSEYDVQLCYQPRSRMKLSDALSRQSNHSTDAGNKTELRV